MGFRVKTGIKSRLSPCKTTKNLMNSWFYRAESSKKESLKNQRIANEVTKRQNDNNFLKPYGFYAALNKKSHL